MSLILRAKAQNLLDTAGLANFHAAINTTPKYGRTVRSLLLLGECGQPFVDITGIVFSKINPGNAEIAIACELLQDFLDTHKLVLDDYIKRLAAHKRNTAVIEDNEFKLQVASYDSAIVRSYTYLDNDLWVRFDTDHHLIQITPNSDNPNKPVTALQLDKYSFNKIAHNKAKAKIKAYSAYWEEEAALSTMKGELSKCDI